MLFPLSVQLFFVLCQVRMVHCIHCVAHQEHPSLLYSLSIAWFLDPKKETPLKHWAEMDWTSNVTCLEQRSRVTGTTILVWISFKNVRLDMEWEVSLWEVQHGHMNGTCFTGWHWIWSTKVEHDPTYGLVFTNYCWVLDNWHHRFIIAPTSVIDLQKWPVSNGDTKKSKGYTVYIDWTNHRSGKPPVGAMPSTSMLISGSVHLDIPPINPKGWIMETYCIWTLDWPSKSSPESPSGVHSRPLWCKQKHAHKSESSPWTRPKLRSGRWLI